MTIFLSWSGDAARAVASEFGRILRDYFGLEYFLSDEIRKGKEWLEELKKALRDSSHSLVFLTPESVASDWVLFEAGALWNASKAERVYTVLCGLSATSVPKPLAQFQRTALGSATEMEFVRELTALFEDLNTVRPEGPLPPGSLEATLGKVIPSIRAVIERALSSITRGAEAQVESLNRHISHLNARLNILATAMDSPAYFLDRDFNILYANGASTLLFELDLVPGETLPLSKFMEEMKGRVRNYDAVMRNFETRFVRAKRQPRQDFEEIEYSHPRYGSIRFDKIGISLLEWSPTGRPSIAGWVVVFNLKTMENVDLYHEHVENIVKARMDQMNRTAGIACGADGKTSTEVLVPVKRGQRVRGALCYSGCRGYELVQCSSVAGKLLCRGLERRMLLTADYGLVDEARFEQEREDTSNVDYFAARESQGKKLVGVLRMSHNVDLQSHAGLYPEMVRAGTDRRDKLVDVGAYIELAGAKKAHLFEGLFTLMVGVLRRKGIDSVYIQTQPHQKDRYQELGFSVVGRPFTLDGWSTEWVPMLLQVDALVQGYSDRDFQTEWNTKTGTRLASEFWSRVVRNVESEDLWSTESHGMVGQTEAVAGIPANGDAEGGRGTVGDREGSKAGG